MTAVCLHFNNAICLPLREAVAPVTATLPPPFLTIFGQINWAAVNKPLALVAMQESNSCSEILS